MRILLTMLPDDNDLLNLGIYEIAPMPCLALYTLAGCLERQGYDVTVLDAQEQTIEIDDWDLMTTSDDVSNIKQSQAVWEDLSDRIRFVSLNRVAPSYDIIGISANSFNWKITRLAVEQIRRAHPDVIIVMGGIHPTWLYRHLLATTPVDYVVRGEGEVVFAELINRLCAGSDISTLEGIAYRHEGGKTVDTHFKPLEPEALQEQGLPAFDLLPEKRYSWIPLETSRGCAYSCRFCSIMFKGCWRPFSLSSLEKRIAQTVKHFDKLSPPMDGHSDIYIVDDTFTLDSGRSAAILEMLSGFRHRIRISLEARAEDLLDSELPSLLRSFNIGVLQIGAEAGYRTGLRRVAKGASLKTITDCAAVVSKSGINEWTSFSFIIGYPWEGTGECLKTLNFALDLANRFGVRCSIKWLFPLPGSMIWERRKEWNIHLGPDFFDRFGLGILDFFSQIYVGLERGDYYRIQEYHRHVSNLWRSVGASGHVILKRLVQFN